MHLFFLDPDRLIINILCGSSGILGQPGLHSMVFSPMTLPKLTILCRLMKNSSQSINILFEIFNTFFVSIENVTLETNFLELLGRHH